MTAAPYPLDRLQQTVKKLRGPDGCPWDRKQTVQSLATYLREEFAEILAAIDADDADNLCEELGDFLYLILMVAEINSEQGYFTISDVIGSIDRKLIRRHPHVFETPSRLDENELRKQWERIKKSEKSNEST